MSATCTTCGADAISERGLCETHFIAWFEEQVNTTIDTYHMIAPGENVLVAASGGKDSLTVLNIISKRFQTSAVCIDEGIAGYREKTIEDLERFCTARNIPLIIRSFKEERGHTLDELDPAHPCTTCGIYRRELLAESAEGFDVIATGHNLDDEAQAILMNICKHHAMRPKPVLASRAGFTRRVKPLYFMPEVDVRRYAFILDLVSGFTECRNAGVSHRRAIQHFLEKREHEHPGAKETLVRTYIEWLAQSDMKAREESTTRSS